jgi:hypothetical protein
MAETWGVELPCAQSVRAHRVRDGAGCAACMGAQRRPQAVELLVRAGFQNVYNIRDGVEGDLVDDPNSAFHGQRLVNGWKNSGLPWTYDVDPKRMVLSPSH